MDQIQLKNTPSVFFIKTNRVRILYLICICFLSFLVKVICVLCQMLVYVVGVTVSYV